MGFICEILICACSHANYERCRGLAHFYYADTILSPCDMNSLATADITLVDNTAG